MFKQNSGSPKGGKYFLFTLVNAFICLFFIPYSNPLSANKINWMEEVGSYLKRKSTALNSKFLQALEYCQIKNTKRGENYIIKQYISKFISQTTRSRKIRFLKNWLSAGFRFPYHQKKWKVILTNDQLFVKLISLVKFEPNKMLVRWSCFVYENTQDKN